ncbi:MAG: hypothetical protein EP346_07010 [Bacteroidetes bacterium]|nr:MAG: hypothetical protein EP346_07010 [Bacteroidota bacterium]
MFKLTSHITIGSIEFDFVNDVSIESSWELLTDKASITLPSNIKVNRNKLRSVLAPGDRVVIRLGYDGELQTIFEGYLTGIQPSTPIELSCEDEMWNLKQNDITDTLPDADLQQLLDKHFSGYETEILNTKIGNYQIDNLSQAGVLQKIKEQFGLNAFFRAGVLVIGRIYSGTGQSISNFRFQQNIIDDDLEYKRKEDVKIQVKAVSNQPNGTKLEVRLGDSEGEKRSLNFYDLNLEDLTAAAQRELDKLKYDGYRGSFTAFGVPVVRHGDIVNLTHPEEADKAGSYFVDKVETTFGMDGYRQIITLGAQA